jgi:hypothetical protein
VYGLITAFCLYLCVVCVTHKVGFLVIVFLPPGLFTGFLAYPFGKDQPTEVWALAKLRFLIKPHTRVWNQSGIKEVVTVTAPKKVEILRTNGLDQTEVKSRLRALADTIDSRGWAVKNVNVNMYSQPNQLPADASDRLINLANLPQEVPNYDVQASDDILDEQSNPIAQQMDQMINASTNAHRQQLMQELSDLKPPATPQASMPNPQALPAADYWFLQANQARPQSTDQASFANAQIISPQSSAVNSVSNQPITAEEQALLNNVKLSQSLPLPKITYPHLKTIEPITGQQQAVATTPPVNPVTNQVQFAPAVPMPFVPPAPVFQVVDPPSMPITEITSMPVAAPETVTASPDAAILALANNNDLNVATLARQAHKARELEEQSTDEVVISLH